jgi:hypothetical protein
MKYTLAALKLWETEYNNGIREYLSENAYMEGYKKPRNPAVWYITARPVVCMASVRIPSIKQRDYDGDINIRGSVQRFNDTLDKQCLRFRGERGKEHKVYFKNNAAAYITLSLIAPSDGGEGER